MPRLTFSIYLPLVHIVQLLLSGSEPQKSGIGVATCREGWVKEEDETPVDYLLAFMRKLFPYLMGCKRFLPLYMYLHFLDGGILRYTETTQPTRTKTTSVT